MHKFQTTDLLLLKCWSQKAKNVSKFPIKILLLPRQPCWRFWARSKCWVCKGVPTGSQHLLWMAVPPRLQWVLGGQSGYQEQGPKSVVLCSPRLGLRLRAPLRLLNCLGPQERIRKYSLPPAGVPDFPIQVGQQVELYNHVLVWNISCLEIHKSLTSAYER